MWINIIILFAMVVHCCCQVCNTSHQCELVSELEARQSCSPMVRPVFNHSSPIDVYLDLMLISTHKIDEKSQIFHATLFLAVYWNDCYMKWNHEKYGGIDAVVFPLKKIWAPDICFMNEITNNKCVKVKPEDKVEIHSTGDVTWWINKDLKAQCEVDITRYPFDEQNCSINIKTWYSHDEVITLRSKYPFVSTEDYQHAGEWDVVNSSVGYEKHNEFTKLRFWIKVRRLPLFSVYYIILPVVGRVTDYRTSDEWHHHINGSFCTATLPSAERQKIGNVLHISVIKSE